MVYKTEELDNTRQSLQKVRILAQKVDEAYPAGLDKPTVARKVLYVSMHLDDDGALTMCGKSWIHVYRETS